MTESLQEHLAENPEDFREESWRITGIETATWAMRKLRLAKQRLNEIDQQATDEVRRIQEWRERASRPYVRDETYFTNALQTYMVQLREEDGRKSLVLPDGEVNSRAIADKAAVADRELFLKFCKANGREAWIRVREEVNLEALKDDVDFSGESVVDRATGEVVEGLVHVEGDIHVTVKVSNQ